MCFWAEFSASALFSWFREFFIWRTHCKFNMILVEHWFFWASLFSLLDKLLYIILVIWVPFYFIFPFLLCCCASGWLVKWGGVFHVDSVKLDFFFKKKKIELAGHKVTWFSYWLCYICLFQFRLIMDSNYDWRKG